MPQPTSKILLTTDNIIKIGYLFACIRGGYKLLSVSKQPPSIWNFWLCCTISLLNAGFKVWDVQADITYDYLPSIYMDSSASVKFITQGNLSIFTIPASLGWVFVLIFFFLFRIWFTKHISFFYPILGDTFLAEN